MQSGTHCTVCTHDLLQCTVYAKALEPSDPHQHNGTQSSLHQVEENAGKWGRTTTIEVIQMER